MTIPRPPWNREAVRAGLRYRSLVRVFGYEALPTRAARGRMDRAQGLPRPYGRPDSPEVVGWRRAGNMPGYLNRAHRKHVGTLKVSNANPLGRTSSEGSRSLGW